MKTYNGMKGKKVLVLGLAKSGEAAARLLQRLGAEVTINDAKPLEENEQAQRLDKEGFQIISGSHPLSLLDQGYELIVKNPGIPYSNPLLQEAAKRDLLVITEIELAYLISEAEIIAITGSNGKTTTTTLVHHMMNESARNPLIAGNIGTVACEVAETATEDDVIVMEVSSFQLMGISTYRPKISVLLNIFDAHLDYHGSKDAYIDAKANIGANQTDSDFIVYNADDPIVSKMVTNLHATKIPFTQKALLANGLSVYHGALYINAEKLLDVSEIVLPGTHNLENILAAVGASYVAGAKKEQMIHVLKTFVGVEHRLQFVRALEGRSFYNDSKATNILATKKALAAFDAPVILLAGGLDRGNEFDALIPSLGHVSKLITFGETATKLKKVAEAAGVATIYEANRVDDAVSLAWENSTVGEVILLSPACASWDQYRTFEERGLEFMSAVMKIG
ncbi:UDP-N-acetylmuramoyl-L-alanine--D-glutamate ligase [Alkalihalobacillus pseudalcaliphilus]|uniref:UDP-N-acetylmuramoyl-L-alanine--D-glutamate ligase n=1 Tax=Alkalihalobacillus pseudalcaliphilus TaxID=79884 RepID=UPI00064E091A|nr:UDP-N-acetylmuramoyl-L-alanine--D-glutamate ligase [Alkalihalobacillus pseudalcaliphilus]KMK77117.1 UDP-N-acetylmuramoyl-L-alanyl-D-glutamate synthetase [Alkalihalobacillus pseudalcaliphilus]